MNAPPPLRLFLDRSTQGRRFVEALRELVDDVETIDDRYGRDAAENVPDLRWITDATADGRIIVGADQLRGSLEKATVRRTGARYVVFGRNNWRIAFMIAKFTEHLPEIRALTAEPGPWIRRISQHDFAELPLDRPGR